MSESKANQCEFHLIKAWTPVSKPYLTACIKSITSIGLPRAEGLPTSYTAESIANLPGNSHIMMSLENNQSRYAIYEFSTGHSISTHIRGISNTMAILAHNRRVLAFRHSCAAAVIDMDSDSSIMANIMPRTRLCKNNLYIPTAGVR